MTTKKSNSRSVDKSAPPIVSEAAFSESSQPASLLDFKGVVSEAAQLSRQPASERDRGLWRPVARKIFRTVVGLAIVGGLGVGVYNGWPVVYDRYIRPVEVNTAGVSAMWERVEVVENQLAELRTGVGAVQSEIDSLGKDRGDLIERVDGLESQIVAHTGRLATLDRHQVALESALSDASIASSRQIDVLKSMELLARARLLLYQANYGLAEQDVRTARDLLAAVPTAERGQDAEAINETLLRLELVLAALPGRPVLASDDLDIAWQILLGSSAASERETTTEESTGTSSP